MNLFFVSLGALLYTYAAKMGISIPEKTDQLFPLLALNHLGPFAAIVFILGITAATFSSVDSVLTTLTTSFCIDFLGMNTHEKNDAHKATRYKVHIGFSILLLFVILLFAEINNDAVINSVFKAAGYTYGPLLGLFAFGLFTKQMGNDRWIPFVCIVSPIIVWILDKNSVNWFNGYQFGFELLMLNGLITYMGIYFTRIKNGVVQI